MSLIDIIEATEASRPDLANPGGAPGTVARGAPPVPILGTHTVLAEAVLRLLPHVVRAEKDAPRPILRHLVIEPDGTMAAMTGTTLAAWREAVTPAPGARVILELVDLDAQAMCKRLAKRAQKADPLFGLELAPSGDTMTLTFNKESLTIVPALWPDEYPNWRHVVRQMRDKPSRGKPVHQFGLDPDLLRRFGRAPILTTGGPTDPIVVTFPDDPSFFGIVMPREVPEGGVVQFPGFARDDVAHGPREDDDA